MGIVGMPWNTEPEAARFLHSLIVMTDRSRVLELGTYKGETTLHLIPERVPTQPVTTIDRGDSRLPEVKENPRIEFILGDSRTFDYGARCFDLIYFDSDHCKDQLFAEYYHLRAAMTSDCILAFHDTVMFPEVREFILLQESCQLIRPVTLPTPRGCGLTIATLL
jgi:predicted O-methyltransferase YrrM